MKDRNLALIERQPVLVDRYRTALSDAGYRIKSLHSAEATLDWCRNHMPPLAIMDMRQPGIGGIALMAECLRLSPGTQFILVTNTAPTAQIVSAIRGGAADFLLDPIAPEQLLSSINAALAEAATTAARETAPLTQVDLIGRSKVMQDVFARIAAVSPSRGTVFITGESGTGKELCARAVHSNSTRADGPFIALNCGGIPHDLLESEVFGHVRGAFTGAISDRPGAAALANKGTLFLDEICELDPALQSKLLRFLETSSITPVGATHPRKVDVRIVCATNRDPEEEVRAGRFREDLFYRIFVLPVHMPPLRERGHDVIEIAHHLLRVLSQEESRNFDRISDRVQKILLDYPWPGNVRQMINVLRQIVVMHRGPTIEHWMLPEDIRSGAPVVSPAKTATDSSEELTPLIGQRMIDIERIVIEETIRAQGGSVPRAAQVLGLSPSTIYRKKESWRD